jgi:hypothetical protein
MQQLKPAADTPQWLLNDSLQHATCEKAAVSMESALQSCAYSMLP